MNKYELKPKNEYVNSYYRKAVVIEDENIIKLRSYDTIVLYEDIGENYIYIYDDFYLSRTTLRHIKEFLKQRTGRLFSEKEIGEIIQEKGIYYNILEEL